MINCCIVFGKQRKCLKRRMSSDERSCDDEELFDRTIKRKDDRRFIVEMPFKMFCSQLGHSKTSSRRRFLKLEQNLVRDQSLNQPFHAFIKDFIDSGHLEKVSNLEVETSRYYYIPHHCVRGKHFDNKTSSCL